MHQYPRKQRSYLRLILVNHQLLIVSVIQRCNIIVEDLVIDTLSKDLTIITVIDADMIITMIIEITTHTTEIAIMKIIIGIIAVISQLKRKVGLIVPNQQHITKTEILAITALVETMKLTRIIVKHRLHHHQ